MLSPLPPYVINYDSASRIIHDKARSDGRCHLDRIAPNSYEETESPQRLGAMRAKGFKNCSWCM